MNSTLELLEGQLGPIYHHMLEHYLPEFCKQLEYKPWVFSLLGSMIIGMSGILPLIIIPTDETLEAQGYRDRKCQSAASLTQ